MWASSHLSRTDCSWITQTSHKWIYFKSTPRPIEHKQKDWEFFEATGFALIRGLARPLTLGLLVHWSEMPWRFSAALQVGVHAEKCRSAVVRSLCRYRCCFMWSFAKFKTLQSLRRRRIQTSGDWSFLLPSHFLPSSVISLSFPPFALFPMY